MSYTVPESPEPTPPTTEPEEETGDKTSLAKTGDTFNAAGLLALLAVGAAGVGAGAYKRKKQH